MNNVYFGTYKSALQTNVSVHDGASSQEVIATELSVTSEGKGKCWVPWTRRAKHFALLVGHLTLPGVYDVSWRELVGLRGNNSNYWSPTTPPHLQLNNRFTSAFWMVLSGEVTGSPFPSTQNTLNHQRKWFIFQRISLFPVLLSLARLILADCFTSLLLPHDREPLDYVPPQISRQATLKIILKTHIQLP